MVLVLIASLLLALAPIFPLAGASDPLDVQLRKLTEQPFPVPPAAQSPPMSGVIQVQGIRQAEDDFAIGVRQFMRIDASLQRVMEVVEDFEHYSNIFDGLVSSKVLSRIGNEVVLVSEQYIPLPFVPNERNTVRYSLISAPTGGGKIYRYSLIKSNYLTTYNGLIWVQSESSGRTLYVEYDFWNANWGVARALGAKKAWVESLRGLYQSDVATKLRAEHPSWQAEKVKEESVRQSEKEDYFAQIFQMRIPTPEKLF